MIVALVPFICECLQRATADQRTRKLRSSDLSSVTPHTFSRSSPKIGREEQVLPLAGNSERRLDNLNHDSEPALCFSCFSIGNALFPDGPARGYEQRCGSGTVWNGGGKRFERLVMTSDRWNSNWLGSAAFREPGKMRVGDHTSTQVFTLTHAASTVYDDDGHLYRQNTINQSFF